MAEIKDGSLQIQPGRSSDKKKVTVDFELAFGAAEVVAEPNSARTGLATVNGT